MKNDSIVPEVGLVINGRKLTAYVKENGYAKWHYECVNHPDKTFRPMRIKDMRNRKGPACCYNRSGKSSPTWNGHHDLPRTLINQIINGAKVRNIPYELTDDYLWQKWTEQQGRCAYTNWMLIPGVDASLDRIDSSKSYIEGNVEWTHKIVNMAKQSLGKADFMKICRAATHAEAHRQGATLDWNDSNTPKVIADFSAGRL